MSTTVETSRGKLQGERKGDLHVFRGIPFARPPVGPLRFRAPHPPQPWQGVRPATAFGHACVQATHPMARAVGFDLRDVSEDCLFLNVWTPDTRGKRPVMVWFHGGGFLAGSSSQYDGAALARRGDVVVVTANYRLGPFGFLHGKTLCGDELDSSGNEGILDVAAALRWVREEIAAFGGDADNITAFGESAGGICLTGLMGMFSARGLFDKVIIESGCVELLTPEAASGLTAALLKATGLTPETASRLREIPAAELQRVENENMWTFFPVVDGEVMLRSPLEAVRQGALEGIPLLIGTNLDEETLWNLIDPSAESLDEAGLLGRVEAAWPGHGRRIVEAYRAIRSARGESTLPLDLWSAIRTDQVFRHPAMSLAEAHSRRAPSSYTYLFTWKSPAMGGRLGATHGLEIPFVFGLDTDSGPREWVGDVGPSAVALSERIQDAWIAFARTGDPSSGGLAWPRYEPGHRATMILGETCEVREAPLEEERQLWESIEPMGEPAAPSPGLQPPGEAPPPGS